MNIKLEVIAVTVDDAVAAERGGADRIELVDELHIGGTTPTEETVRGIAEAVSIPVFAMVRPRGGDAIYNSREIGEMIEAAHMLREAGASGIVVGALRPDGALDLDVLGRVLEAARLPATFHKAFDDIPKDRMLASLDELAALKVVERVLTSAGEPDVEQGRSGLRRLVEHGSLSILPGGGVTAANLRGLVEETGVREVHVGGAARPGADGQSNDGAAAYDRPVQADAVRHLKQLLRGE